MKFISFLIFVFILLLPQLYSQNSDKVQLTEKQKIENLIQSIETLKDAQFYRNGSYHDAKEAAGHLRMKLGKAGSRIKTAKDFIEKIGSESYLTGTPYKIKFSDGQEIESKKFLLNKLKEIE